MSQQQSYGIRHIEYLFPGDQIVEPITEPGPVDEPVPSSPIDQIQEPLTNPL